MSDIQCCSVFLVRLLTLMFTKQLVRLTFSGRMQLALLFVFLHTRKHVCSHTINLNYAIYRGRIQETLCDVPTQRRKLQLGFELSWIRTPNISEHPFYIRTMNNNIWLESTNLCNLFNNSSVFLLKHYG